MLTKRTFQFVLRLLASVIVLVAWVPPAVSNEPTQSWQMVGQIGGPTQAVAVQGNYAYVGVGLRLVVLDISNPADLVEVGNTAPFPYFVEDIVVQGTMAYVAAGGAGLRVVDVADLANPVEMGAWDSPGYAEGVAVSGSTVYLADGPYGLWTVDVSDPAHPQKTGAAYDMNYAFEVAVSGGYAFIAAAGAGLLVADISDPAHPVEVGALDTPGYAYGIAVSGTLAYLADAWEGLRVVDVANPVHPMELGAGDTPGWALNVAVDGSMAYVADGAFGLRIVNVSDPAHPAEVGTYEVIGLARRIAFAGETTFVADLRGGLRAVDVTDAANPAPLGLYSPLADADRTAVSGNYAYVAAGFSGLHVVDISDPAHPREVAAYDTLGCYATDVVIDGSYAYLAMYINCDTGLHVLDISDPTRPVMIGALDGGYRDLALQGNYLYAPDLLIIDVSNPAIPTKTGYILVFENEEPTDVAVSGTMAYVIAGYPGVGIIDVSDPYHPTLVSIYDTDYAMGVAVAGSTLYIGDHGNGMRIIDASDPLHSVELGRYDTPGLAGRVTISGNAAYVADYGAGMQVVDVSDPRNPRLISAYNTLGFASHITLAGGRAFVSDRNGGLVILERTTSGAGLASRDNLSSLPTSFIPSMDGISGVEPDHSKYVAMPQIHPPRTDMRPIPLYSPFPSGEGGQGVRWEESLNKTGTSATCLVTSTADSGSGTLRQCLTDAQTGSTIQFDPIVFPPANPATIYPESPLPEITQGNLTIDASNAGVILDGSRLSTDANGLFIRSDNNLVMGLQIFHFHVGLVISEGKNNIIGGDNTIGRAPNGQGNVLSLNGFGIHHGGYTNRVIGNFIGTDASGTAELGNDYGIWISMGDYNRVGGPMPGERNIISANHIGVVICDEWTVGNLIAGNNIGTDINGERVLGNTVGVMIWDGPDGNTVGGTGPGESNLISGNDTGMFISGLDANHNTVIGNRIGTDISGKIPLGNRDGVTVCGAGYNRIEGNLISGNGRGFDICQGGWPHSLIRGNLIGTDASGTRPLGNGMGIGVGGWHMLVGGTTVEEQNVIASSQGSGIVTGSAESDYNWIAGNIIGIDASQNIQLGNGTAGILVENSSHAFIQGNTIANNGGGEYEGGIYVVQSLSNSLRRNSIFSNHGQGIVLAAGGNNLLPAPVITASTPTTVSGTACPGCTVEVFSDAEDEGQFYEGTTVADLTGHWLLLTDHFLTGPHLTATATDALGNTSQFSLPAILGKRIHLPLILKGLMNLEHFFFWP